MARQRTLRLMAGGLGRSYSVRYLATGSQRRLQLDLGAGCIPKAGLGEDAFFASSSLSSFGLADGVGGWADRGVDAGKFSRALLRTALQRADLAGVAREAFQAVRQESHTGSCTLLLGQLQQDMVSLLNLGDCGIMVLRPMQKLPRFHGGTVTTEMRHLYRSTAMLHRRNLPLQLSSEDKDFSSLEEHYDLVTCAPPWWCFGSGCRTFLSTMTFLGPFSQLTAVTVLKPRRAISADLRLPRGFAMASEDAEEETALVWFPINQSGLDHVEAGEADRQDGTVPQRRKHFLGPREQTMLQEARSRFWSQHLKLNDQLIDLQREYEKKTSKDGAVKPWTWIRSLRARLDALDALDLWGQDGTGWFNEL
eukprot:g10279.t1